MDLLSVMNQRASDQYSELHQHHLYVGFLCCCAGVCSVIALYVMPCALPRDTQGGGTYYEHLACFLFLSILTYVLMLRVLHSLNASRVLPTPLLARGRQVALLVLPVNENLGNNMRRVLPYTFYISSIASLYFGASCITSWVYVVCVAVQWCCFLTYGFKLYRLVYPLR